MLSSLIAQNTGVGGLDLGSTLTLGDGTPVKDVYKTPADLVNLIVPNLFVLGGIAIFVMMLVAGYKFISNTAKGKEEALNIFKNAVIGFVIMFSAYWALQILKLVTGADIPL